MLGGFANWKNIFASITTGFPSTLLWNNNTNNNAQKNGDGEDNGGENYLGKQQKIVQREVSSVESAAALINQCSTMSLLEVDQEKSIQTKNRRRRRKIALFIGISLLLLVVVVALVGTFVANWFQKKLDLSNENARKFESMYEDCKKDSFLLAAEYEESTVMCDRNLRLMERYHLEETKKIFDRLQRAEFECYKTCKNSINFDFGNKSAMEDGSKAKRLEMFQTVSEVFPAFFTNVSVDVHWLRVELGLTNLPQNRTEFVKWFLFAPLWPLLNSNISSATDNEGIKKARAEFFDYYKKNWLQDFTCPKLELFLAFVDQLWTVKEVMERAQSLKNFFGFEWNQNELHSFRSDLLTGIQTAKSRVEVLEAFNKFQAALFVHGYRQFMTDQKLMAMYEIVTKSFPEHFVLIRAILRISGCPWSSVMIDEEKPLKALRKDNVLGHNVKDEFEESWHFDQLLSALVELRWPPPPQSPSSY